MLVGAVKAGPEFKLELRINRAFEKLKNQGVLLFDERKHAAFVVAAERQSQMWTILLRTHR